MIGVGVIALVPIVLSTIGTARRGTWGPDDVVLVIVALPVALLLIARGATGSWSKRQLRVDVAAGKLQLASGSVRRLDELGELSVETQVQTVCRAVTNYEIRKFRLRASELEHPLFTSVYENETKLRHERLAAAVSETRARSVAGGPARGDGAFHDPRRG